MQHVRPGKAHVLLSGEGWTMPLTIVKCVRAFLAVACHFLVMEGGSQFAPLMRIKTLLPDAVK